MPSAVHTATDVDAPSIRSAYILTAKLLALLDRFNAAGIPVIPIKGPVLSQMLYGDPAARSYEDLDLLVRKRDVPRAMAVLEESGYVPKSGLSWVPLAKLVGIACEMNFQDARGTMVDLHWELAPSDYPFRFDPEILWSQVRTVRIVDREVPGLAPECLLLFLCVHGAKHAWSRLTWLRDVERLICGGQAAAKGLNWDLAIALAESAGCIRPLLLGLLLAHEVFEAPVPQDVFDRAHAIPIVSRLAAEVKNRLEAAESYVPSGIEMIRFNVRLTPSRWAAFKHYAALLKTPTEADASILRLPPALFFLYYPFRLFRLIGKYGSRLIRTGSDAPGTGLAD